MKTVIFDFGQVLVRFEPSYMVGKYVDDPVEAALLAHIAFDRKYWDRLDAGTITDAEVVADIRSRVPAHLHGAVEQIYYNWIYNIPEIEGMRDLILHIKRTYGVHVYLLSNISTYFASHAHEIPILDLVDGCVFSAVCGLTKPDAAIFTHICEKFELDPAEAVFVDDKAENVQAACALGMQGYVFDGDARKLRAYFEEILQGGAL